MILEDILNQVHRLTTHEQLLLLEAVSRALRADLETRTTHGSAEQLLGVIAPADHLTDAELEQIRFEHLMEKHS